MSDQNLNTIAAKVSKAEKTPELGQYWQKRYEKILSSELFKESEKTAEFILSEEIVENPATPFGDINLLNHLDANGKLDDIKLQSTVETAVRFLDSCLDIINFDQESKFIVTQYRKIGVGLGDISEFLEKMEDASELKTIDHLGNLISNSAYRASETLAEEKSPCSNWNQINRHLRPRSFEVWIDPKTDQRYTGLNLSEEYDEETILETDLQIIPRRNSNILLFPPDLEWQIWSDRDNLAPATKIIEYQAPAPKVELEQVPSEVGMENTQQPETEEEISDEIITKDSQSLDKVEASEPDSGKDAQKLETSEPQILAPEVEEVKEVKQDNSEVLPKNFFGVVQDNQKDEVLTPNEAEEFEKDDNIDLQGAFEFGVQDTQKVLETPKVEPEIEHDHEEHTHPEPLSQIQEVEDLQIGELVKIVKQNDPEFGKIYQIVDLVEGQDKPARYHLAGGNPEIEKVLWSENDLEPIDLDDLLINLNSQSEAAKPNEIEAIKAEFERQKNLEVALYKEQIKEEMVQKYANKTEDSSKFQDDTKVKQLEKELKATKSELNSLKQSLSKNDSKNGQIELTVDELEDRISERVKEYLASAEYKNQINRLVQEKTASLKNKSNSPTVTSISNFKILKKYQNYK